ncbi:DUF4392 domain-containing protein [Haliea sp. E1-2-M8]|uniref:glutamate cyclase domain-containing protein n=1 Tax=Haliea sp. E1-2-M8 TaxID=3064706 RepID=UPI00271A625F|nr:glutamate cyclase domain-containing protein [Haliea sp. E1-2-M8]MDO8863220.1 DUF4392 domain-containing protein [Haliea sp. E1-2-M8]
MNDQTLSETIEALLVARNPRHMQTARAALQPGYYLRAAELLRDIRGTVLIGTGFPVGNTFETDGPVGAIALYQSLEALGAEPVMACASPLAESLAADYRVLPLALAPTGGGEPDASAWLAANRPAAVISIERPGVTADGHYYNMRGEDISPRCGVFDPFLTHADCPTIAIGDGGNEIGMGKIADAIRALDIRVAVTGCGELLVADVSNWGAYGLLAFLGRWSQRDLLGEFSPLAALRYLSERGSVDGVTRENTLTEDGMAPSEGEAVIREIRRLTGFAPD